MSWEYAIRVLSMLYRFSCVVLCALGRGLWFLGRMLLLALMAIGKAIGIVAVKVLKVAFCEEFPDRPAASARRSSAAGRSGHTATGADMHRPAHSSFRKVMDPQLLAGGKVLVLGAGSVGSWTAYSLASVAPVLITLVDYDKVEPDNIAGGRTIYEASHCGMQKVLAAKSKIERDYPQSTVGAVAANVMDLTDDRLQSLTEGSLVVIAAIDDGKALFRVNRLMYPRNQVLYPGVHTGAHSGHIIITTPCVSACLECCLGVNSRDDIHTLHAEPGLSLDIRNISNYCAILALEIMYCKVTGQPIKRWDTSKNVIYIINKRERQSRYGPGVRLERAKSRPFCRICS